MRTTLNTKNTALALAAAGLFNLAVATGVQAETAADAKVQCYGVTSCAGQNDCKTAENSCKGQASCKGHGFKLLSADECKKAGGTVGE